MNYRHLYHAGNFADITKHAFLVALLQHFQQKAKPFFVLDTHAGLGRYDLGREEAQKRHEYASGFSRLFETEVHHAALIKLKAIINEEQLGARVIYPGSPLIASHFIGPKDRLVLVEKHPETCAKLRYELGTDQRMSVHQRDAYEALKALLPMEPRRGLILIDPPYELKDEYQRLAEGLKTAYLRFPQGVYLIWYPIKADSTHLPLANTLFDLGVKEALRIEHRVMPDEAPGLLGSGLLMLNPPWGFAEEQLLLAEELAILLNRKTTADFSYKKFTN
jgi:23S rRNA (adenine2030-N6)-methyltransferase